MNSIKINLSSGNTIEIPVGTNVSLLVNGQSITLNYPDAVSVENNRTPNFGNIKYFGDEKIESIKAVRELGMFGLRDAMKIVENFLIFKISTNFSPSRFQAIKHHLETKGIVLIGHD